MSALKKIVIVNTSDQGGGAERASMLLLDGLNNLGLDTWLLVGSKKTQHPRVLPFHLSPFIDYRLFSKKLARKKILQSINRRIGLEDFEHPFSHRILDLTGSPPDLVICHNLHGGFFDLRVLPELSSRVPVVLRLFDAWLFAGHCAHSKGCTRWKTGCGRCPDLQIPPAIDRDATRINWWRKKRIFQSSRVFASAETEWMIDRAKQTILAPAVLQWSVVGGGVDQDIFSPGAKDVARQQLGLQPEKKVLLYVAHLGLQNPFKDVATVRRAAQVIGARTPGSIIELIVVGSSGPLEYITPNIVLRQVGPIMSEGELATYYRAADVYVHSAFEETFGNTVAEALSCGRPVVVAAQGGVLELIDHGRTGLVVPHGRSELLADALLDLLLNPDRAEAMGAAAAFDVRPRLDARLAVKKMRTLCVDVHEKWQKEPAPGL